MKRVLLALALGAAALCLVLAGRALRLQPAVPSAEPYRPDVALALAADRLAAAVRIPTLSPGNAGATQETFIALRALLQQQFPRVHARLSREVVGEASLLFHWQGREACPPRVFAAHQDVVPVEPGTEADWTHPPFSGAVSEGAIWGRGALDDKASLLALLEGVEGLLGEGFSPRCDVWFAFGHDEEVGGGAGAAQLAERLARLGVRPALVLDEGGAITRGALPGADVALATIGVAEKGFVSVRLAARDRGGHSSMPPRHTAIGRVARAVTRLEAERPPADFGSVQRELLARLAPHAPFDQRVVLANLWLTAPLVERLLAGTPAGDASLRTSTAPTLFHAGVKDNVLPQQAEAVVNFRIRPGDSIAGVLAHVRATIDDPAVEVAALDAFSSEPTAPAPWDDPAFAAIEQALRRVSPEPDLVVAPYTTLGGTDARHYARLTDRLYRFLPVLLTPDLLDAMHGTNERLPLAEYERMLRFYRLMLRES